jgi:hypothetical protein
MASTHVEDIFFGHNPKNEKLQHLQLSIKKDDKLCFEPCDQNSQLSQTFTNNGTCKQWT